MAESSPSGADDQPDQQPDDQPTEESLQNLVVGRFRIETRVGRGGMGEVYRAQDTRLKRTVALKRLAPALRKDALYRRRFLEEAESASRLSDPHVAGIYDVIEENGEIFLVMEFVEGETLRQRLTRAVTLEAFLDLGTQCAGALMAAHRAGVVHGDIKPENIMLTYTGQVKILDFGLAKTLPNADDSATVDRAGTFAGTPAYMAPEVLMEVAPDARADIFSLGVVFYEVLTARHPFQASSFMATCDRIRRENPAPVRSLNSGVPVELQEVVTRMLAKMPEQRYASARELQQDLRYVQQSNSHPELVLPTWAPPPFWKKILIPVVAGILGAGVFLGAYHSSQLRGWLGFSPPLQRRFLAVLPFAPASGDANGRAFSDGVTEALAARLTQLTASYPVEIVGPREIRAESVQDAEQVRKVFGANLALEGSLSKSDHLIRVSYSLVDTATRRQLHADTVTVDDVSGPLSLEDRLVESIVSMLGLELRPNDRVPAGRGTVEPAAYDYYLRGRGYLQNYETPGNLDQAIDAFQQALQRDEHYALASAGLGEGYWHRYEGTRDRPWIDHAMASCQRAAAEAANLPNGHDCLGVVYNGTGEYEKAAEQFQQALSVDSTNDDAFRGLAAAEEKLGHLAEAEKAFLKAIQMRPQYWAGHAWLGGFYYHQARYDDAAREYTEWIALAPDSFEGYNNLGAMYLLQGRYGDAIPQLRRSADINPSLDAYSNLGTSYFYQGSFADAVQTYREAVRVGENDAELYYAWGNLAEAYYWCPGEREHAKEAYARAIALAAEHLRVNPRDGRVLSGLALYHAMLGEKSQALSFLQRALRLAPQDAELQVEAAKVEVQFGQYPEALASLEKARKLGVSVYLVRDDPEFGPLASNVQFQNVWRQEVVPKPQLRIESK